MNKKQNDKGLNVSPTIAKPMLSAVLFQDEINAFLKEQFYESWMDDNDWLMFLEELETQSGISVQSLSNDLQMGLKNGHSIEKQFELVRTVLKNGC